MSSEWIPTTLGRLLILQRGMDLPTQDRRAGQVPIVASTGIVGYHDHAPVKGPGVVIGRSGSIGGGQYVQTNFWPLNTTLWVKEFNGNDVRFCYYLLRSMDFRGLNAGSGVPTLNRNHLHPLPIVRPPVATQKRISNFLGALDDRIALLREANVTLEAIAQALFKSWFVDFDPVRAKQQGLPPVGMDEATAKSFPDGFEESAAGPVPRGWSVQPVGDVVECIGGATPDTKDPSYWTPGEHPWTTPKDLSGLQSPVLLRTERRLSTKGLAKVGSGLLPAGTLLLSSRAPIGYLAIAQVPVAINQGYIAMSPRGLLPPLYMLFWCRQNMEGIKARANGSTFMEISKRAFRPIPAVVPPGPIIDSFLAVVSPLFDLLVTNERQAQTLATLRDTLLPRLISGQLRLPEADVASTAGLIEEVVGADRETAH